MENKLQLLELKFTMNWIYIILAALDLAGVYFNVRMLLSCFTIEPKREFLHKYRPLVICQFVYQVSVLAMNSIEAWSGLDVQHDESSCIVLKMTSICINIFLVSNLVAMLIVAVEQPITYNNQELSPKLLMLVPVCLGFIGSAILWWCNRSSLYEFECQVIAIIFFVVFLPLPLVTWKKYTQRDQTSEKLEAALPWAIFKENKKVCVVTVWLLICCGVVIASGTSQWSSYEEFDEIVCLFMINSVVGIGLPVVFNELFYSICGDEKETKTVVI